MGKFLRPWRTGLAIVLWIFLWVPVAIVAISLAALLIVTEALIEWLEDGQ
ncbi:MAG: hypothetical protein PHQ05_10150 [Sterolibacterium sp.]|nr:hypothetical protein [Sterolibacterium sp.]